MSELRLPLIVTPPGVKGALEGLGRGLDREAARCRELEDALVWLRNEAKLTPHHLSSFSFLQAIAAADRALGGRGS